MLPTLFAAGLLILFLALIIIGWIKLSPKLHLELSGPNLRGFEIFKLYLRLPQLKVDFNADYMAKKCHFSLEEPGFSRETLVSLLWGARMALMIEDCKVRLSPSRMKILIKIKRLSIFYSILPDIFKAEPNHKASRFTKFIARLVGMLVSIEIGQIDLALTTLSDPINKLNSIYFVGARMENLGVFKDLDHLSLEPRPTFYASEAEISMVEFQTDTFDLIKSARHTIALIDRPSVSFAFTDDSIRFDISSVSVKLDFVVSDILFAAAIANMAETSKETNGSAYNGKDQRMLFSIKSSSLTVVCHLPDLEEGLKPISKVRLALTDVLFDFVLDDNVINYIGSTDLVSFGAFFSEDPDPKCFTKCDHILGRIPDGLSEHTLISIKKLNVSNSKRLRESTSMHLLPKDTIKALMQSLLNGKVCWDHLKQLSNHYNLDKSPLESIDMSNRLDFLLFSDFNPGSLIILVSKLEFSIPFEFPLSSLVETLVVMIKSPIMMFRPEVRPQSFDVFSWKWEILLHCPNLTWIFGDDPFESRLARIIEVKRKVHLRMARIERMFWKRLKSEKLESLSKPIQLPIDAGLTLLKSASCSSLIGDSKIAAARIFKMHEALFDIYKTEMVAARKDGGGLMDVQVSNVDLKLKWDPSYLGTKGIHDLLNALEDSTSGYTKEMVEKFSLFLGAFMEFSGNQLNVYLRDYKSEFISIDRFQLCGPVFLLEESAYPDACVKVPVKTGSLSGNSNICKDMVTVIETILPVKFFHSVGARFSGDYGVKAAFCPFWDGMFVGLDRAFDMLSKQSRERSPRLAIWDKFRLFVHSSYGYIFSDVPCYFSYFPGKASSVNESLLIKLDNGFEFERRPDKSIFEFQEFEGLVESKSMSILRRLLETKVPKLMAVDSKANSNLLKLIHFAKTRFILDLDIFNCYEKPPVEHQMIRMTAIGPADSSEALDSYKEFRLSSIITRLDIETDDLQKNDITFLYLYDELISWVKNNLLGYTKTSVRKGPLFISPFIVLDTEGKDSIVSILDEIHFKFHFNGAFSCVYLNFFDSESYGGLHLSSTETRIALDYSKSRSLEGSSGIEGKWTYYYGEVDFKNVNLDAISSDHQTQLWTERFRAVDQLRLLPTSIFSMTLINSPRLFYTCIDDLCFKSDPKAKAAQVNTIQLHKVEKLKKIQELSEVASTDEQFLNELAVLKEHYRLINESMASRDVEKHFYFIHEARLYWHKGLRNCIYKFTDQQFVRHIIRTSKSRLVLESIRGMNFDNIRSPGSPRSSPIPKGNETNSSEDIRQFYEKLMKRSSVMYAVKENIDTDNDNLANLDLRSPLDIIDELNDKFCLNKLTEVFFFKVQLVLADDGGTSAAITAPVASVEVGSIVDSTWIPESNESGRVGSRTKVSLENMCIFVSDEVNWTTMAKYEKITEPASAAVVFNVKDSHYSGDLSLACIGMDRGNSLIVHTPELNLFMNSSQYAFVHQLISQLLVYRDPGQQERAEQLESLVLASDILDKSAIVDTIESLQMRVHDLEVSLTEMSFSNHFSEDRYQQKMELLLVLSEELGLIVESMMTIKSSKEKWGKKQTRLQLDVIVDHIELTMLRADKSPMIALTLRTIRDIWISDEDFSMSNLLEIGVILASNKTPKSFYKTLVEPLPQGFYQASGIGLGLSDQILRFYWKSLMPVGGIPIVEHVELNLAPLTIQLSYEIASEATKFFFPSKPKNEDLKNMEFQMVNEDELVGRKASKLGREASFRNKGSSLSRMESMEEIMTMKQKASNNCSFISIRVPATQHFVSYKGRPGTTITDIENFMLRLPSFEYHNKIWSWSEVFLQLRKDAVRIAMLNAGSLLKEKIKRLGQSNLSEEEKLNRTPVKAKPLPQLNADKSLQNKKKLGMLLGKSYHT